MLILFIYSTSWLFWCSLSTASALAFHQSHGLCASTVSSKEEYLLCLDIMLTNTFCHIPFQRFLSLSLRSLLLWEVDCVYFFTVSEGKSSAVFPFFCPKERMTVNSGLKNSDSFDLKGQIWDGSVYCHSLSSSQRLLASFWFPGIFILTLWDNLLGVGTCSLLAWSTTCWVLNCQRSPGTEAWAQSLLQLERWILFILVNQLILGPLGQVTHSFWIPQISWWVT